MKERIDVLLVKEGFFESREKAQRAIMAGLVLVKKERIDKPGTKVNSEDPIEVKGNPLPYVGRGGLKLEKAIRVFDFRVENKVMIDIGSSTGGFTDCALQNGAAKVYAVDVGYNQLAWKLRQDSRVVVMERTNFRYATLEDFSQGRPEIATIDVSFISLTKILPALKDILAENGEVIALIKPQFEAGRGEVGKRGIVKDPKIHRSVLSEILIFAKALGFEVKGLDYSPITGGDGNIEFLAHLILRKPENGNNEDLIKREMIEAVVKKAHSELKKNSLEET